MASSSSSSSAQPSSILSMPSVTTVKLNPDNFLMWKAQLVPYFKGQDLFGYLDGSIPKPPKFIFVTHPETSTVSERLNSAYTHWVRQDNLILSTLMTSSLAIVFVIKGTNVLIFLRVKFMSHVMLSLMNLYFLFLNLLSRPPTIPILSPLFHSHNKSSHPCH